MSKKEFEEIKKEYQKERKRLEGISKGDLVWESIPRGGEMDYHPAVVTSVNVDENYIDVIDVSDGNKKKRYFSFDTESELIRNHTLTKKVVKEEYKKYGKIIKSVLLIY